MLTKSLHTVTAVKNVATMLLGLDLGYSTEAPEQLVKASLSVLGYEYTYDAIVSSVDPTILACTKAVYKLPRELNSNRVV